MSEMQVFNNPEFGSIRTIEGDGKILFCASDIAKALGYQNPSKAISDHCRGDLTKRYPIVRSDGSHDARILTQWTQKGRLLIHEILTARGITAVMDRGEGQLCLE